jgi:chromosomal replication initiator protein
MLNAVENSINTKVIEERWPQVKNLLMSDWGMLEPGINAFIERSAKIISFKDNVLTLSFDDIRYKDMFEKDYMIAFEASYSQVLQTKITLNLIISTEKENILKDIDGNITSDDNINSEYTFENFIKGPSNEHAYAAAVCVSENPGKEYNPLFLYGGTGLGKTHLLYAIANKVKKDKPKYKIIYVDGNDFVTEYVNSMKSHNEEGFKNKFYNADVLLVDDIQYISGKPSTMDEFFNTFNMLYKKKKQIVIASDMPPKELDLNERLISRFVQGLSFGIEPPNYETRYAILLKKQEKEFEKIDSSVLEFIAFNVSNNVRELENAYNKVIFTQKLTHKKLTSESEELKDILRDLCLENNASKIDFNYLTSAVCQYYNISKEELFSKSKKSPFVDARHILIYLLTKHASLSQSEITKKMSTFNHSKISYSIKVVSERIKLEDEETKKVLKYVNNLISNIDN